MKIRAGFVSNSSGTSFTCDFCGEEVAGMDLGLTDAEMFSCKNGHTVCDSHTEADIDGEDRYEGVPENDCPVCCFDVITTSDLAEYLLKKSGQSRDEVRKEVKYQFTCYKNFRDYLKEKS